MRSRRGDCVCVCGIASTTWMVGLVLSGSLLWKGVLPGVLGSGSVVACMSCIVSIPDGRALLVALRGV